MFGLGKLFENESVQKLAFGGIKKIIKNHDLKCIIVSVDPATDEIKLEFINNQNQKVNADTIGK